MNIQYPGKEGKSLLRQPEPLAIVGMSCRLPGGVRNVREFWDFLRAGRTGISEMPRERWNVDYVYNPDGDVPHSARTKWGGFVDDIYDFDAGFFEISPREAEAMDPQQRILLHLTWEALEDAGVSPDTLAGTDTGVFIGASTDDYAQVYKYAEEFEGGLGGSGGALSVIPNRISNRYDFRGPSMLVDTACSASLVSTHLACRSIWLGDCDTALAGGVNALFEPSVFVNFSKANMLSPTGRCHSFDADADGYVRSEGAGLVLLKRLSKAVEDGDRIYAVIRGTAVNQDGYTTTLSVPTAEAQARMMHEALDQAGLAPEAVGFVEAHSTGTPVGDPIESAAIAEVFGKHRTDGHKVYVGAVKSAVGHLESGAGITGLIKTALSVYHGKIPPNLNFKKINPNIPLDDYNLALPLEVTDWPAHNMPRMGLVNSFGFGGTDACAIVGEAPRDHIISKAVKGRDRQRWLIPLSAANEEALKIVARQLRDYLKKAGDDGPAIRDVAGTLSLRRGHLGQRAAIIAESGADLVGKLDALVKDKPPSNDGDVPTLHTGKASQDGKVVFAFSGQGGQWHAMARQLLDEDKVFRAAVEEFDALFQPQSGWSAIEELYKDEKSSRIHHTEYTQAGIFAVQIGLAARWKAWGIEPQMVVGHSLGEVAAAYVAGALSLKDAVTIIHYRGMLTGRTEGLGKIGAVGLSADEAREYLANKGVTGVEIGAINTSGLVSLAGEKEAVERTLAMIEQEMPDVFVRYIKMDYAPHTKLMERVKDEFLTSLMMIRPKKTTIPFLSTVTGMVMDGETLGSDYWWRNIRQPVLFKAAIDHAVTEGFNTFVELGPHGTLAGLIAANASESGSAATVVPSLERGKNDEQMLYAAAARLYTNGIEPDWKSLIGTDYALVDLPRYPWQAQRFFPESEEITENYRKELVHPMLGARENTPLPEWRSEVTLPRFKFIRDHKIGDGVLMPATAYVEMMIAAAIDIYGDGPVEVEDIAFREALFLREQQTEVMRTVFEPERSVIQVFSRTKNSSDGWTLRASGKLRQRDLKPEKIQAWNKNKNYTKNLEAYRPKDFYNVIRLFNAHYGPAHQGIKRLFVEPQGLKANIFTPREIDGEISQYNFHPALFDCCLQMPWASSELRYYLRHPEEITDATYLPTGLERVRFFKRPPKRFHVSMDERWSNSKRPAHDFRVTDAAGNVCVTIKGLTATEIPLPNFTKGDPNFAGYYREKWVEAALEDKPGKLRVPGQWIVFSDGNRSARALVDSLRKRRQKVTVVRPGNTYSVTGKYELTLRPTAPEDYKALLDHVRNNEAPLAGIFHAWSLDAKRPKTKTPRAEDFMDAQDVGALSLLNLAKALSPEGSVRPRLWVLTAGHRVVGDNKNDADDPWRLHQTPTASIMRTLVSEYSALRPTLIDLDAKASKATKNSLISEILADTAETEIVLRGAKRYVNRLAYVSGDALPARTLPFRSGSEEQPYRATMSQPGMFDNIKVVEDVERDPGPDEVLLRVRAVGVNFRDIMAATGLLPKEAEVDDAWDNLGLECSGQVLKAGKNVRHLKRGDKVMTAARGSFRSHLVVPAKTAYRIPRHISYAGAATIPSVFLTAYHALINLGRLRKGERVLIHAATGGVGLAAVQIARMAGAEIFATAGSEEKRAYLKKLGIKHVMNSRTLDFADEIMQITDGKGVDVILNSLAGPAIDMGVSVLAPFGRWLEIGKRDIYEDNPLGLKGLRKNIAFHVIDMANIPEDKAYIVADAFKELGKLFRQKKLEPLPVNEFPVSRMAEAFDYMSKARHIGKVVVSLDEKDLSIERSTDLDVRFRKNASYLITGGAGGFGLEVAKWMAEHGAGHLILMSRSGASTAEAKNAISAIRRKGTKVTLAKGDVSKLDDVKKAVAKAGKTTPLRGIIHGAMVLDDGFIQQLDNARFKNVLTPKMMGAWNLHVASRKMPLDFFLAFSSVAAIMGSAGQGNYVAANAFLDALMDYRHANGMTGTSIQWGVLGDTGVVHRDRQLQRYLDSVGMPPLSLPQSLKGLSTVLRKDVPVVGYFRADWQKISRAFADVAKTPRLADVVAELGQSNTTGGRIRTVLLEAPATQRHGMIVDYLADLVSNILKTDKSKIGEDKLLSELGLSSLSAFELRNRIEADLALSVPVGRFLEKPTLNGLAEAIAERLARSGEDTVEAPAADTLRDDYPLSYQQEWWWRLVKDHPDSAAARFPELQMAFSFKPGLDRERLSHYFDVLVERYPILRARLPEVDGKPTLEIADSHQGLEFYDATGLTDGEFKSLLDRRFKERMDLDNGPLTRMMLFRRPDHEDVLLTKFSHFVCDGWSVPALITELFSAYAGSGELDRPLNDPRKVDFGTYVQWERKLVKSRDGQRHRRYWLEKTRDPGPLLSLPLDRRRTGQLPQSAHSIPYRLGKTLSKDVVAFSKANDFTTFTTMLSAFKILLGRLSGAKDIPVWHTNANRGHPETANVIGWVSDVLLTRDEIDLSDDFMSITKSVEASVQGALEHQDYPGHKIMEDAAPSHPWWSSLARSEPSQTSMWQVMFHMRSADFEDEPGLGRLFLAPGSTVQLGPVEITSIPSTVIGTQLDLKMFMKEYDGEIFCDLQYNADLFDQSTITDMIEQYRAILNRLVEAPDQKVADVLASLDYHGVAAK